MKLKATLPIFFLLSLFSGCTTVNDSLKSFGEDIIHTVSGPEDKKEFLVEDNCSISQEEEYWLGRAVAGRILSVYKPSNNAALNDYVIKVGLSVAKFSARPDVYKGYSFQVLESKDINAVSAPGGFVFITTGLLNKLKSEDELAAVLAHEISHIQKQHGLAAIQKAHKSKGKDIGGKIVSALTCSELTALLNEAFEAAVDDMVNTLLEKGYSRDQEFEADQIAFGILKNSGYNELGLGSALTELKLASASAGGWFSTHPSPEERIVKIGFDPANYPLTDSSIRAKRFRNK